MKLKIILTVLLVTAILSLNVLGFSNWETNTYYAIGDIVTYNGQTYICIQAHTSQAGWTPSVVPALWQPYTPPTNDGSWSAGVYYEIGDKVKYDNVYYIVRQSHTSQNDWLPSNVPALYLRDIDQTYKNQLNQEFNDKFEDKLNEYDVIEISSSIKVISYNVKVKHKITGEEQDLTWLASY